MLAITYKKITKIKVAEWGTPKKYLKKKKKRVMCMQLLLFWLLLKKDFFTVRLKCWGRGLLLNFRNVIEKLKSILLTYVPALWSCRINTWVVTTPHRTVKTDKQTDIKGRINTDRQTNGEAFTS